MSKDGGPAFPGFSYTAGHGCARRSAVGEWEYHDPGMSLRDYFAAMAMQAAISTLTGEPTETAPVHCAPIARDSYEMADAMLKAREQSDGDERSPK